MTEMYVYQYPQYKVECKVLQVKYDKVLWKFTGILERELLTGRSIGNFSKLAVFEYALADSEVQFGKDGRKPISDGGNG